MRVLIGVTGGIAAYKAAFLVRLFIRNGDAVKVVMTESAARFVTPLTFQTLSGDRVHTGLFPGPGEYDDAHIALAKWAETFVIAPATANTIAKLAHGLADNLLTAAVLALPGTTPVYIAPAMNTAMYTKAVTRANLAQVALTAVIVGPVAGRLACGDEGMGAMAEPALIFKTVINGNKPKRQRSRRRQ
ncbi:MAG: flavoprotein [Planctomycetota bacterium]